MTTTIFQARLPGLLAATMLLVMAVAAPAAAPPAADTPAASTQPGASNAAPAVSKETRDKLATMHEQMAACLRSDKTFAECRVEMRKACREMMSDMGCPTMGMGPGMGMGRRHMMPPPPAAPAGSP